MIYFLTYGMDHRSGFEVNDMKLTLETERLILRPFEVEDAQDMFDGWTSDPVVARYVTWNAHKNAEETAQLLSIWSAEYEKPERLNFAIVLKANNKLIGGIDVVGYIGGVNGTPVIGYNLAQEYWGNGYMTEACKCVIDYLFSKGYSKIRIDAMSENIASIKVIQKCGGVFLETEEEYIPAKGKAVAINKYIVKK
ncbi:GNAT family N-acetyltransferase [uncultured Ruminococcus sp.]|uniref:GNAT family N-acetyltransferase n=1 Tax=uncultured Ruminococcus sp. TaxID=165186 RepID=UPI0025E63037|nr:GNAT family N-acetyltransferase [uncultured Ruminococcus sp.]